jgi:carbon-monoxide dehydrogenase medium subunit
MKLRLAQPETLVDIGRLPELKGIKANGSLSIGAMTTHMEITRSADVQRMCRALSMAANLIGDPQVRNFGTLGGNIAHADPAADPPPVLVACDAVIHTKGPDGERSINAADFFVDLFTVDLEPGELITRIEIPDHSQKKSAYVKLLNPASRYAIVGVCVLLEMNGGTCTSAQVAIGGAVSSARRCPGAEAALSGTTLDDDILKRAAQAIQADIADDVMGDATYPEDYRLAMAGVYLKRAVQAALG